MLFSYRALRNNEIVVGKVDAISEQSAASFLKANNYLPLNITEIKATKSVQIENLLNRVNFNDIVNFTRQLSIMLNAGLTLIDAFDILKKQVEKKSFLDILLSIDKDLKGGNSFSESLKKFPKHFSNLYIALVKSGEASGKLSEVLLRLADDLEKSQSFQAKIKGALVYPTIVITGMIIVGFIMMTFVLPNLLTLFKDLNAELPMQTKILIAISGVFSKLWYLFIIIVAALYMVINRAVHTPEGKAFVDRMILKIPIISPIVKKSTLVNATRTLSILIGSGVSILDALSIIIGTTTNSVYRNAFESIWKQIERGTSLGQAMINENIFPPILVQMTLVGEQTGHLDETLLRVSNYFQIESEAAVKTLTTLIEPAILVVLGLSVAFLVSSIITPLYSIGDAIK